MTERMIRLLFLFFGHIFVGLGLLGIFLPIMPTTPFLIVAAFCYSKGSERFHTWLLEHRQFGPLIRDWLAHRVIRRRAKIISSIAIVVSFSSVLVAMTLMEWHWGLKLGAVLLAIALIAFILTRPSQPVEEPGTEDGGPEAASTENAPQASPKSL